MRFVIIVSALMVGSIIALHTVLQNGSLQRYLDEHPDPKSIPTIQNIVGDIYYFLGDLQQSATSYLRVAERYPQSESADGAYYWYLRSLDEMNTPRQTMADLYQTYLDRFPDGEHKQIVTQEIMYCRNNR